MAVFVLKRDVKLQLSPGEPGYAGTRKVKPIWILMKQEMMGWQHGISCTTYKSFALRSRQITMPETHQSIFFGCSS